MITNERKTLKLIKINEFKLFFFSTFSFFSFFYSRACQWISQSNVAHVPQWIPLC